MVIGRGTSITERARFKLQNLQFSVLTGHIFLMGNTELKSLCFTRRLMLPPKHRWTFFITVVRENLANYHESPRISVNSCPIRAAFGIFSTNSWSFL